MQRTPPLVRAGQQVPHFRVEALDHTQVAYSEICQRKNLVLVLLPEDGSQAEDRYVAQLEGLMAEVTPRDSACVISRTSVPGLPRPGIVVADRWGEIHFGTGGRLEDLPAPAEIVEWLRFVQVQCPECQGETK
jgi:hypothetical protein